MAENRIDYSSRDYASILAQMLIKKAEKLPNYSEESDNDLGILLIQLFALLGDSLSYYIDRILSESFLSEARERPSVLKLAKLLTYTPALNQGAAVDVTFTLSSNPGGTTIPKGDQAASTAAGTEAARLFALDEDLVISAPNLEGIGACTHGTLYSDSFTGNGLASQQLRLANAPVVAGKIVVEVDSVEWTEVSHLVDKDDDDQVYVVLYQENRSAIVLFGDGVYGKIPPDSSVIETSYLVGGGPEGKIVAGRIDRYLGGVAAVASVTNVSDSSGGVDREGMGSIKANAPMSHKTAGRAVTIPDFESIALGVAGVQQSKAIEYGGVIRVSVVPDGGGLPSGGLKSSVASELDTKRMRGTHVVVEDPIYTDIDVTVVVVAEAGFKQSIISDRATKILQSYLNPNKSVDGIWINGFGEDVFLSEVYELLNSANGVARCSISTLKRASEASGVGDVGLREIEIRSEGTISVTVIAGQSTAEFEDAVRKIKKSREI